MPATPIIHLYKSSLFSRTFIQSVRSKSTGTRTEGFM